MVLNGNLTLTCANTTEYNQALADATANSYYTVTSQDPNTLTLSITINNAPN